MGAGEKIDCGSIVSDLEAFADCGEIVAASGALYALETWARWMRSADEYRTLWYPASSPGLMTGGVVAEDAFADLEEECNYRLVLAVDAAINSLPPAQRAAIERHFDLCRCVRVRDFEGQLSDGCRAVYLRIRGLGV